MPHSRPKAHHLSILPSKQAVGRASFALLVTAGVTLVIMSKTGNPVVSKLRMGVTDIVAPVLAVAARPIDAVVDAGRWFTEMATIRQENIALKNQNLQLKQWQLRAQAMETEDAALRELLKVVPSRNVGYVTAPVVSDVGGPYMHSALLGGGAESGITKDRAVINAQGLLGRVVEAGERSARVLLLRDINSRVPVIAETAQEKSILVGGNNDLPTLSYLSVDSRIQAGDRIVTSGDGGVYPKGIAVGLVSSVDNGVIKVQPFVDESRLDFVTVVDSPIQK